MEEGGGGGGGGGEVHIHQVWACPTASATQDGGRPREQQHVLWVMLIFKLGINYNAQFE